MELERSIFIFNIRVVHFAKIGGAVCVSVYVRNPMVFQGKREEGRSPNNASGKYLRKKFQPLQTIKLSTALARC